MTPFRKLEAVAAPMLLDSIDTDAIIPVAQIKTLERKFAGSLFFNQRYRDDGSDNPDFVLNQPQYRDAKIIVAGYNFGCGSSREHAVWALLDYGIRCVVAGSFGDIFYSNSIKGGLLPVKLPPAALSALGQAVIKAAGLNPTIIDLESQLVTDPDGGRYQFRVEPSDRRALLEGLDSIGLTLLRVGEISSFQAKDRNKRPWIYDISLTGGTPT